MGVLQESYLLIYSDSEWVGGETDNIWGSGDEQGPALKYCAVEFRFFSPEGLQKSKDDKLGREDQLGITGKPLPNGEESMDLDYADLSKARIMRTQTEILVVGKERSGEAQGILETLN